MTLENVRLKVEAFDYLQLPINITEGCIGRLVVQVMCSTSLHPGASWLCYLHVNPLSACFFLQLSLSFCYAEPPQRALSFR